MRVLILVLFLISLFSCTSTKTVTSNESDFSWDDFDSKFLLAHSFQKSAPKQRQKSVFNHIESANSKDGLYKDYFFKGKMIFRIGSENDRMTLKETFDNNYLIISYSTSRGAASMELTSRDKIFIISLNEERPISEVISKDPFQFTFHKYFLERYGKGAVIFAIDNITENTLVLLDADLKYKLVPLKKVEGLLILE